MDKRHWKNGRDYVLGKSKLKLSNKIITLLNSGFGEPNGVTACFEPRHSIQYNSIYGKVKADICFECRKTNVYINGWNRVFLHTSSVLEEINKIFEDAGVRLPVKH